MDFTHCVVYVTCADRTLAEKIATDLVEQRLAACASIIDGATSIFRWEDRVDTNLEWLLMIKTRTDRLESLTDRVKALHPYKVPEVIALPIIGGNPEYLDWLEETTQ